MHAFARFLLFISNFIDFDKFVCFCKMLQKKEQDTRSATTNFRKEDVLKIRQGIQVFAQNTRMIPFVMLSLSRIDGTLPYIYIYIYIYMYRHIHVSM